MLLFVDRSKEQHAEIVRRLLLLKVLRNSAAEASNALLFNKELQQSVAESDVETRERRQRCINK